jgi:hypothetical protein
MRDKMTILRESKHLSIELHKGQDKYFVFENGWMYDTRSTLEEANKLFEHLLNTKHQNDKVVQVTFDGSKLWETKKDEERM